MGISVRAMLTAGVCGVTAGAVVLAPSAAQPRASFAPSFSYTAYSLGSPGVHTKITPDSMRQAVEFIESIGPSSAGGSSTTAPPALGGFAAPRTIVGDSDDQVEVQNAASDGIDSVYTFTRYWANYVALDLGPWLINWVPFGYLVSDQIDIWYNAFVLPVVDSFVYKFLDPIVNDPLNLGVWWNGAVAIADAALEGVGAGIAGEINYVLSLGWLPFPLPPLPGLAPQAAANNTADPELRMSLAAASGNLPGAPTTESTPAPRDPSGTPEATEPTPEDPQTEAPEAGSSDSATDPTPTSTPEPTAPTPDNSGASTPTATPTPTPSTDPTDAPDDDGAVVDDPGTHAPSTDTETGETDTGTDTDEGGGNTGHGPADGGTGTDTPHETDPGSTAGGSDPGTGTGNATAARPTDSASSDNGGD